MGQSDGSRIPRRYVRELDEFHTAHARWLAGYARVRTNGNPELAADLVQDVFEAAARAWETVRGLTPAQQGTWLQTTLMHKDISEHRRREALRGVAPRDA
jgi:DNA-directed RNA polymerase specialized sigma24 family protein